MQMEDGREKQPRAAQLCLRLNQNNGDSREVHSEMSLGFPDSAMSGHPQQHLEGVLSAVEGSLNGLTSWRGTSTWLPCVHYNVTTFDFSRDLGFCFDKMFHLMFYFRQAE